MKAYIPFLVSLVTVITLALPSKSYSIDTMKETLTVAGFVNLGDRKYDDINVMITTYLSTFFSKLFKNVPDYSKVEKAAVQRGFWSSDEFRALDAIAIADTFGSRQCVTGFYIATKDSLKVSLHIYDIKNKNLVLQKAYTGGTGNDVFKLVDRMVKDILYQTIGSSMDLGRLRVHVKSGDGRYRVFLNGNYNAEVSKDVDYESLFMAGQIVDMSLIRVGTGKTVLKKSVKIEKDEVTEAVYQPVGNILVNTGREGLEVYLNNSNMGMTDKKGELQISNVISDGPVELAAKEDGNVVSVRRLMPGEGELIRVEMLEYNTGQFLSVPLRIGMLGWFQNSYVSVGLDLLFAKQFRVSFSAGGVFYSFTGADNGIIPTLGLGAGYVMSINKWACVGVNLTALMFLVEPIYLNPVITIDFQLREWVITAGARYSFDPLVGGFYPVITVGYRF